MATNQVNQFYGDAPPPGAPDGTTWINSANGFVYVSQNGKWVEEGTTLRGPTGQVASAPSIFAGTGAPSFNANQGSLYTRTDGASGSARLYYNTNGAASWANLMGVA